MNKVIHEIRKYKELKADIRNIELKLEELEEDIGITEQPQGERIGQTYKITSTVETQAIMQIEKKEALNKAKNNKKRKIARIENALSVLKEEHREVIQLAHIELKAYWRVQEKVHKSYTRVKQLEIEAAQKMEKYILQ